MMELGVVEQKLRERHWHRLTGTAQGEFVQRSAKQLGYDLRNASTHTIHSEEVLNLAMELAYNHYSGK